MPTISKVKKDKISEQILHHLFSISPESAFTVDVAKEIARDEEFTKALLQDLVSKKLIVPILKNSVGKVYTKRTRWRLSNTAYEVYSRAQDKQSIKAQNSNIYNLDI